MINFLKPYNDGLKQIFTSYRIRNSEGSHDKKLLLNGNGSGSVNYCQLDIENQIPLFLYTQPPGEANVIVVDIGSGWGACAKQLALLGYKVYSVDISQSHLEFQKDNFCKMPTTDTFLYNYWKVKNPEMLDEQLFSEYCHKIKDKNIVYVAGNFADKKVVDKIQEKQWNIALSLDSLQFMEQNDRDETFKLINRHIQNKGIFVLKTKRKRDYGYDNFLIYDFDLHSTFQNTFAEYKILSGLITDGEIIGLTLYKLNGS